MDLRDKGLMEGVRTTILEMSFPRLGGKKNYLEILQNG